MWRGPATGSQWRLLAGRPRIPEDRELCLNMMDRPPSGMTYPQSRPPGTDRENGGALSPERPELTKEEGPKLGGGFREPDATESPRCLGPSGLPRPAANRRRLEGLGSARARTGAWPSIQAVPGAASAHALENAAGSRAHPFQEPSALWAAPAGELDSGARGKGGGTEAWLPR